MPSGVDEYKTLPAVAASVGPAGRERHLPFAGSARHPAADTGASDMGKYLLAWVLGVPAFVLILIYLFMH